MALLMKCQEVLCHPRKKKTHRFVVFLKSSLFTSGLMSRHLVGKANKYSKKWFPSLKQAGPPVTLRGGPATREPGADQPGTVPSSLTTSRSAAAWSVARACSSAASWASSARMCSVHCCCRASACCCARLLSSFAAACRGTRQQLFTVTRVSLHFSLFQGWADLSDLLQPRCC